MTGIVIETERMVLRHWAPGDVELWMTHLNTPAVRACLGGVDTREAVDEKFSKLAGGWEREGFSFLAVDLKACGTFLGTCGIARIESDCAPEELRGAVQIGWQLREDHWGQGYGLESARAMLAFGFEQAGLDMIYSQTSLRNRASWGLMEKLGLSRRADLDYVDPKYPPEDNPTIIYALAREDWRP
jgi:RimJ/RimL family protein N-acetyltransferase